MIDPHLERVRPDRAGEPLRDVERVERNDAALLRLDPEQARVVGVLGHRKNAGRIRLQQDLGRDVDPSAAVHGVRLDFPTCP